MSYAEIARQTGQPYHRVRQQAFKSGAMRARDERREQRQVEAQLAEDADRAELYALLKRYEDGDLVPGLPEVPPGLVAALIHDVVNARPAISKLRQDLPSNDGDRLTRAERRALEDLQVFGFLVETPA